MKGYEIAISKLHESVRIWQRKGDEMGAEIARLEAENKELTEAVKEYLAEIGNPAPDATMRMWHRRKLAELVGVEDPADTFRRWREVRGE